MKKIHVILDEMDKKIVDVVRGFPGIEIIQWDYSFDTAYQWLLSNRGEKVDVFLASEYTQVSTINEAGKQLPRDTALLHRIRDIYLLSPQSKFLLLCDHERTLPENKSFLTSLVSIGIYDFRTVETLTEEKLKEYIEEPKRNISYVQEYLSDDLRGARGFRETKQIDVVEKKEPQKDSFLIRARKKFQELALFKKEPQQEFEQEFEALKPILEPEIIEPDPVIRPRKSPKEVVNIYSLGLDLEEPNILSLKNWDQMLFACQAAAPSILLFSSDTPNLSKRILKIRKNHDNVFIAVIGSSEKLVGVDEVFPSWDNNIIDMLKEKKLLSGNIGESRDSLTNLYDRRFLDRFLQQQQSKYYHQSIPFSFIMIDIDHFKKINDTYGHQEGDRVLIEFAAFLEQSVREDDVVARYGGEEFSIVLPGTSRVDAGQVAHKLRQRWRGRRVTFSAGVAEFGVDGKTTDELIRVADNALYKAKKDGRDLICMAGETNELSRPLVLTKGGELRTTVYMVVGSAPRVGATSFCLALASFLSENNSVEVLDAGGGASEWVKDGKLSVRKVPPFSVVPGLITIVDAGTDISRELQPFTEVIFIVTDLSRGALNIKKFVSGASSVYLVGNRNVPPNNLNELANLWDIKIFASLGDEPLLRDAELNGRVFIPKQWKRQFFKIKKI